MFEELTRRRLALLYHGLRLAYPSEGIFELGSNVARDAGYPEALGEEEYLRVLEFDVKQLEKAGVIVKATDHGVSAQPGVTPYRLTDEGRQMLVAWKFHLDPRW
jgi:hypothetical protein